MAILGTRKDMFLVLERVGLMILDNLLYITGGEFYETDDTGTSTMYYQGNTLVV
jgi:hypothetical protein